MNRLFQNIRKAFVASLISIVVVFSFSKGVSAKSPESYNFISQRTLPGSSFYLLKRVKEKLFMLLAFSNKAKYSYRQVLLGKRLSELIGLVDKKDALNVANASQRFAYEAGMLTEIASKNKGAYRQTTLSLFEKYKPILEELRDNFPANSAHWLLIQQDIDTLNILEAKLE